MMEPSCINITELTKWIMETSLFGLVLHELANDLGELMLERALPLSRKEDRGPLSAYDSKKTGPLDGLLHGIASLAKAYIYQLELRFEAIKRAWPWLLRGYWSAVLNCVMGILQVGTAIFVAALAMGLLITVVGELQKWFTDSELQTVIISALYSCFALRLWFTWRSGKLSQSLVSFGERIHFDLRRFRFSIDRTLHPGRWNYDGLTSQFKRAAETLFGTLFELVLAAFGFGAIVVLVVYVGPYFSEKTIPDDVVVVMVGLGLFVALKLKRRNRKLAEIRGRANRS
jgi:hypothetical protein